MSAVTFKIPGLIPWREWHAIQDDVYSYFTSRGHESVCFRRRKVTVSRKMSPVPRIVLTLGQDKEKEKKGRDKRLRRREPIVPTTTIWSGFALHVNPAAMPNHPLDTTTGVTVSVTTYVYLHTRLAWDDVMDIVAIINRPSGEERVIEYELTIEAKKADDMEVE